MPKSNIALSETEIEQMEASVAGLDDRDDSQIDADRKPAREAPAKDAKKEKEPVYEFGEGESEEDSEAEGLTKDKKPGDKKSRKEGERQETVPFSALHAEREERKKIAAERDAERLRNARLDERLNALSVALQQRDQQTQPVREEPEVIPVPKDDPMGAIEWQQQQILRTRQAETAQNEARAQQQRQQQTAEQQQNEWNQAVQTVGAAWQQAKQGDPQLEDAYVTLRQSYSNELQALGWFGPALTAELDRIESGHILECFRKNRPIDQLVFSLAKARTGWKPKDPEDNDDDDTDTAEADALKGKQVRKGAAEIDRLRKAQDASSSLSNSGGGAAGGNKMTLEALDRMPQKEFEKLVRRLSKSGEGAVDDALAKMMGVR